MTPVPDAPEESAPAAAGPSQAMEARLPSPGSEPGPLPQVEPEPAEPPVIEALDIPLAAPPTERPPQSQDLPLADVWRPAAPARSLAHITGEDQAPAGPQAAPGQPHSAAPAKRPAGESSPAGRKPEGDVEAELDAPTWLADQTPADPISPGREISNEPTFEPRRRRNVLIGPLGLGMLAGCFVFFIIALGLLGYRDGMQRRAQKLNEAAALHYTQGLLDMDRGDYERAAAEFEEALRLRRNFPEAEEKLIEARSKASGQPTATPPPQGQAPQLLAEGKAAYDKGNWDEAIQKLDALRRLDPTYEQATAQRLLVGAYTNSGIKLVNDGSLEEAIRLFNQALTLEPDNPDVQSQLRMATLYQSAISIWGVDWPQTVKRFSALYALKPDYMDTAQRLRQANIEAGEAAAKSGAWCEAEQYDNAALALATNADVAAQRDDAAHRCAAPTEAPAGTDVPSGTFVGVFKGYEDITKRTKDWAAILGRVTNPKGEPVPGVRVRLSAYDWANTVTTAEDGTYKFEFLNNELTFTVSLEGVPMQPVEVATRFGFIGYVDFQQH